MPEGSWRGYVRRLEIVTISRKNPRKITGLTASLTPT
jgi:hypothetical protein